jgi:hypothetical protein
MSYHVEFYAASPALAISELSRTVEYKPAGSDETQTYPAHHLPEVIKQTLVQALDTLNHDGVVFVHAAGHINEHGQSGASWGDFKVQPIFVVAAPPTA